MPDRAPADGPHSTDAAREMPPAAPPDLASGEQLLIHLRGIGASMFVTTERLIIARDGRERRPRSGVQSFLLGAITHIRLEPGTPPSGRIAVWIGSEEVVSMFFDARSSDRAQEALEIARPAIARHRRRLEALARLTSS